eukprot:scaffold4341_cov161-Amphora_coffeaeformis.AAC.6
MRRVQICTFISRGGNRPVTMPSLQDAVAAHRAREKGYKDNKLRYDLHGLVTRSFLSATITTSSGGRIDVRLFRGKRLLVTLFWLLLVPCSALVRLSARIRATTEFSLFVIQCVHGIAREVLARKGNNGATLS